MLLTEDREHRWWYATNSCISLLCALYASVIIFSPLIPVPPPPPLLLFLSNYCIPLVIIAPLLLPKLLYTFPCDHDFLDFSLYYAVFLFDNHNFTITDNSFLSCANSFAVLIKEGQKIKRDGCWVSLLMIKAANCMLESSIYGVCSCLIDFFCAKIGFSMFKCNIFYIILIEKLH